MVLSLLHISKFKLSKSQKKPSTVPLSLCYIITSSNNTTPLCYVMSSHTMLLQYLWFSISYIASLQNWTLIVHKPSHSFIHFICSFSLAISYKGFSCSVPHDEGRKPIREQVQSFKIFRPKPSPKASKHQRSQPQQQLQNEVVGCSHCERLFRWQKNQTTCQQKTNIFNNNNNLGECCYKPEQQQTFCAFFQLPSEKVPHRRLIMFYQPCSGSSTRFPNS